MLHRRTLLNFGGSLISAVVGAAATSKVASAATTTCLPDSAKLKTRNVSKFEVVYKTPRGNPNGLALTNNPNEIWIINQAKGSHASLINLENGFADVVEELLKDGRVDPGD